MYTFQPQIDTNWDTHAGFYMIAFLCACWLAVMVYSWWNREMALTPVLGVLLVCVVTSSISYNVSYRPQIVYENIPVTAEFVQFNNETVVERSGKYTSTNNHIYVTYKVGDDMVVLPAKSGVAYPKTATLYRN